MTESAIPSHLRCPRIRPTRCTPEYQPPYPAFTARWADTLTQVVMATLGVQYRGCAGRMQAQALVRRWQQSLALAEPALRHDVAHAVDTAGWDTLVVSISAIDPAAFDRWWNASGQTAWWMEVRHDRAGVGCFFEILRPRVSQFETLLSYPEGPLLGVAQAATRRSGPIQEHGYWGSMRDRLPVSQSEDLRVPDVLQLQCAAAARPDRVALIGHDHLCLIRSGQDWSDCDDQERKLYERDVQPVLEEGMQFLASPQGLAVGCLASRFLTQVDTQFQPVRRSYGLSTWHSMEHLERWSEEHPTHVAIFGSFMRMVGALHGALRLRLWHEVAVAAREDQQYLYLGCHPRTGLLRAAPAAPR